MFSKALFCRAGPVGAAAASAAIRTSPLATVPASARLFSRAMPLRAKVTGQSRARSTDSGASPSSRLWQPLPEDESEDVLFTSLYGLRTIELNRPKKYNSLNASMIRKIAPRLLEWEKSDMANVILLKGAGEKALCAGGDVAALAEANARGSEGQAWSSDYFALEYKLDHLIATYQKPYVALMDGITMGGGVGLSVHAPFRIATERTVFAMPETNIGFFPDVGATFFLPRMPGGVGTYLALTSERLTGCNVFYAGVATHYLHSTSLPRLEARLAELRFHDYDDLETRLKSINSTIDEFATGLPYDEPILLGGDLRRAVDRCFTQDTVSDVLAALREEAANGPTDAIKKWAEKTLETLHHRSPTSVHVTLRQMRVGLGWTIAETFKREHQIASRFMRHPDFTEGVSSLLIRKEKTRPKWQPSTLDETIQLAGKGQDVSETFFQPPGRMPDDPKKLALLNERDYFDYPHQFIGLPTENDVFALVNEGARGPREVVNQLVALKKGKQGVKEVVEEVLARKTTTDGQGKAVWVYDQ